MVARRSGRRPGGRPELWLGLLGGVAFAVVKAMQRRRGEVLEPVPAAAPVAVPPPPPPPARPTPKPAAKPAKVPAKKTAKLVRKPTATKNTKKAAPAEKAARQVPTWVDPKGDICPQSHPVKAKLASGIFHLPGSRHYDRTRPDRCYQSAEAAENDGLRPTRS